MKILLLEYITGGGLADSPLPAALVREGRAMAAALASDLLALPEVELLVPWDARLSLPAYACHERAVLRTVADDSDFRRRWTAWLAECDAVWPVAPESGGALEGLCREVEQSGRRLLNSPASAVALAASKSATNRRLATGGILVAPSYPLHGQPADMPWPRLIKPDDGVGCDGVFRLDDQAQWSSRVAALCGEDWLVQPCIVGDSLSLSALFYQGEAALLSVNRQLIELDEEGAFHLTGCEVSGVADYWASYNALARRIAKAVPELAGYAGVDFIQGEQGPVVLEINPRLTSSYPALSQSLGLNPARLVLDLFERGALPPALSGAGRAVLAAW